MALELRSVPAEEATTFTRAVEAGFGHAGNEEAIADYVALFQPDWAIAVYDAGRIVATTSADPFELTLPGGFIETAMIDTALIETVGVTAVTVSPTHRRRGLLTQMMTRQLDQFRERGVAVAILTASEAVIYGRFGYGLATSFQSVAVDTPSSKFARPVDVEGRFRMLDAEEAAKVLPAVHDRACRLRPGDITRPETFWQRDFRDREFSRNGGSGRFYVVHESPAGEPDGYASYRYFHDWPDDRPAHRVEVEDLYAVGDNVLAAMWRFLLDLDLVRQVRADRPVDDPLRWLLADARQCVGRGIGDHLWVRLVDIPVALEARGYGGTGDLVLEVPSVGRYVLSASPSAASCREAHRGERGDVELGLADLGAIYLGGVRPSLLAAAGRINELRPGALARADSIFLSPIAPYCGTGF
jgi:predicted acetyltransferase